MFSAKTVFFTILMVFGRSGGVRGHGMDHTKRFPRTLAGFGLTWHGELDFHVFRKYWKLTPSPNNSKLVLGPPDWSSDFLKARVPSQELSTKLFSRKITPRTIFSGKLENLPKSLFVDQMASFLMPFFLAPYLFLGPMGPGTTWGNPGERGRLRPRDHVPSP